MASAPGRKPLSLFDTPAGFDDPLEMLVGCHRRIEKQLQTMKRLREHLQSKGVDAEATSAAEAILRYFGTAAVHHHEDEEKDLFPLLERRIDDAQEAERFAALRAQLEGEHREMEAAWARVRKPLEGIAEGLVRQLPAADVDAFTRAYESHIAREEGAVTTLFGRWIGQADRETLGRAMAARRGVRRPGEWPRRPG